MIIRRLQTLAFYGTVLFSWNYPPVDATHPEPPKGFRISVGTVPGRYFMTVQIDGDVRAAEVEGIDTTKVNYAAVAAFNEWGQGLSSEEIAFGGAPLRPFSVTVKRASQ